jgi:hypothetical protein
MRRYFRLVAKKGLRGGRPPTASNPRLSVGIVKNPWMVDAHKLAEYLDRLKQEADADWQRLQ